MKQILALWIWVGLKLHPIHKNENLDRFGHLLIGFELVWTPSPPLRKLKFGQILALWIQVGLDLAPTPLRLCGNWCMETNRSIPQGYRLVFLEVGRAPLLVQFFLYPAVFWDKMSKIIGLCPYHGVGTPSAKPWIRHWGLWSSRRIQGGSRGARAPPLTLGFEAPKLSILLPYLIFP